MLGKLTAPEDRNTSPRSGQTWVQIPTLPLTLGQTLNPSPSLYFLYISKPEKIIEPQDCGRGCSAYSKHSVSATGLSLPALCTVLEWLSVRVHTSSLQKPKRALDVSPSRTSPLECLHYWGNRHTIYLFFFSDTQFKLSQSYSSLK